MSIIKNIYNDKSKRYLFMNLLFGIVSIVLNIIGFLCHIPILLPIAWLFIFGQFFCVYFSRRESRRRKVDMDEKFKNFGV